MEIFEAEAAMFILNLRPSKMAEVIACDEIDFFGSEEEPSFTWSHLERYISENDGVSIQEAQRYIAEKVFEIERMLA